MPDLEEEPMKSVFAAMTLVMLAAAPAFAQVPGDPAKGRQFAQQICSECHNVEKGQRHRAADH